MWYCIHECKLNSWLGICNFTSRLNLMIPNFCHATPISIPTSLPSPISIYQLMNLPMSWPFFDKSIIDNMSDHCSSWYHFIIIDCCRCHQAMASLEEVRLTPATSTPGPAASRTTTTTWGPGRGRTSGGTPTAMSGRTPACQTSGSVGSEQTSVLVNWMMTDIQSTLSRDISLLESKTTVLIWVSLDSVEFRLLSQQYHHASPSTASQITFVFVQF